MNADDLAAAEAEAGPTRREALAAHAQQQVIALVQACQALLAAYGAASASSASASAVAAADDAAAPEAPSTSTAAPEDLERLHDLYVERRAALRESLERCRAFQEEEDEDEGGEGDGGAAAPIEALAARRRALVAELEAKNGAIKVTIDRLREMLDALQLFRAEASA